MTIDSLWSILSQSSIDTIISGHIRNRISSCSNIFSQLSMPAPCFPSIPKTKPIHSLRPKDNGLHLDTSCTICFCPSNTSQRIRLEINIIHSNFICKNWSQQDHLMKPDGWSGTLRKLEGWAGEYGGGGKWEEEGLGGIKKEKTTSELQKVHKDSVFHMPK